MWPHRAPSNHRKSSNGGSTLVLFILNSSCKRRKNFSPSVIIKYGVHQSSHFPLFWGGGVIATSCSSPRILVVVVVVVVVDDDGSGGVFFLPSSCCRTSIPVMVRSVLRVFKSTVIRLPLRRSSTQKYAASQLCSVTRILNLSVDIR